MRIEKLPEGIRFEVKVQPKSSRNEVKGIEGNCLKVKVTALPAKGKANKQLIKLLTQWFWVRNLDVEIERGEMSRVKCVQVRGVPHILIDKIKKCAAGEGIPWRQQH